MIIEAKEKHIITIAQMLAKMYQELFGTKANTDFNVYISEVINHYNDSRDTVFIDDKLRGFFIVRDETEVLAPTLKRYNGLRVYIEEKYRKGRLLSEFYSKLFEAFPDGDILGSTEINSEHIAVLEKRHTRIANVYKLNRKTEV